MHAGGLIRAIHVAAAALVVVGAIVAAARPALARRYEWAFWTAILVLVITGIGNFAAIGGAQGARWTSLFRAKLLVILTLLLVGGARVIVHALEAPASTLRAAYGVTGALAAAALTIGLVIAHG